MSDELLEYSAKRNNLPTAEGEASDRREPV